MFSSNVGKYGPEKTPYLDTFHAVEATAITKTQSSTTLYAPPWSSIIPFEAPVPATNVIPSPAVSVSSTTSVLASTNAVPSLKN